MKVRMVIRPMLAPGIELTGLPVIRAGDAAAAADAVRRSLDDPEVGIVLVDDVLHDACPPDLRARLDRRAVPVVAPFPTPRWDARSQAERYVVEMLRQAIGYRVRPR